MATHDYLSIGEFAKLSGIKRKNLIFYDEIGLFSPTLIKENGYRYYTYLQLDTANVIWSLKEIGMSLSDIRLFLEERTPQTMIETFEEQKKRVRSERNKLKQIEEMLQARIDLTKANVCVDTQTVNVTYCKEEPLFFGPEIDTFSSFWTSLAEFYAYTEAKKQVYSFPLGAMVSQECLREKKWSHLKRFYYRMPTASSRKPAGWYVIGYAHADYEETAPLYERLDSYISEHKLEIIGPAYEEYVINEISTRNISEYVLQVAINVSGPSLPDQEAFF